MLSMLRPGSCTSFGSPAASLEDALAAAEKEKHLQQNDE